MIIILVNIIVTLAFCFIFWLVVFQGELFKRDKLYKWIQIILISSLAFLTGRIWKESSFDKWAGKPVTIESVKELIKEVLVEEELIKNP